MIETGIQRNISIVAEAFWPLLKAGLLFSIPLTLISFTLGLILAFLITMGRLYGPKPLSVAAELYIWIFRGTPLLVQLFIIFYGLPSAGIVISGFLSAVIGFTLNVGAYTSEILRGAIVSVSKGQWEASKTLGFSGRQTMFRIILPQALRVAVPSLSNSFISLVKDTSLAAAITVPELFQVAQQITARTYEPMLLYTEAAVIYLMFCTVLTIGQKRLEDRFNRPYA